MPTLRPQRVSGLVVTPTLESVPGLVTASLAIDVGMSRTPPPDVVTREDLVVEVRNPTDGSLEPIASPDPGPLPVRALRVVQARADFTFGPGGNPPTEVRVNIRGDQKIFPVAQTFSPVRCLRGEPDEGDRFPIGLHRPGSIFERIPQLLPFARPGCCVRHFEAPDVGPDPVVGTQSFEIEAQFLSRPRRCRCDCCEYRQYVRGTFTSSAGPAVRFDMPGGPLDPARWCEDGAIEEFGTGHHGFYGHRADSTPGDEYSGAGGCTYRGTETPSCAPTETAQLEFMGLIVDRCRGRVTAKRTWAVNLTS